jgi:hypothetical protein
VDQATLEPPPMAKKGVAEPPHGPDHPQELEATPNWPIWGWLESHHLAKMGGRPYQIFTLFAFLFLFLFKYIFYFPLFYYFFIICGTKSIGNTYNLMPHHPIF